MLRGEMQAKPPLRAVILDGARTDDAVAHGAAQIHAALEERGLVVERFVMREITLAHCVGCFQCWIETPGRCRAKDRAHDIARAVIHADMVVYATAVTFGGYASPLKMIVDRLICLVSPFFEKIDGEVHHRARYDHYPGLLAVGWLPRRDDEAAASFRTVVGRNAINFHCPFHDVQLLPADRPGEHEGRLAAALDACLQRLHEEAA